MLSVPDEINEINETIYLIEKHQKALGVMISLMLSRQLLTRLHLSRHTCDNIFAMAIPGYSKVQNFEQIEYTVMLSYREANFIYGATSAQ